MRNLFFKILKIAVILVGFFMIYLPIFTIFKLSFGLSTEELSFNGYAMLFHNSILLESAQRSFIIALGASTLATILGTTVAVALERTQFRGRKIIEIFLMIPFILPEMVLGLALLIWFAVIQLSLGWISMILAHTTFGLSYVVFIVRARLKDFDRSLEEAARDLGASSWIVFTRITLPLIFPGIASGFFLSFILSFDDFIISFFTAGVGTDTLPLKIYSLMRRGFDSQIYALSSLLLLMTMIGLVVGTRVVKKVF